jgi:ubiquinone/menaquinone biosynthesis C-methylase UbiE
MFTHVESLGDCQQVLATDGNEQQLRHATPAPNETNQHGDAHSIPLQDSSVDLVTAASSLHWFDLPQFVKEVRRVLKPHGCLAAWAIPLVSRTGCRLLYV